MWSSRRNVLLGAAALAGCGFTPVYGPDGGANGIRDAIRMDAPNTRDSFDFVAQMEQRLGRPNAPRYDLSYAITTRESGLAITGSNFVTRFNVQGTLTYAVRPVGAADPVTEGVVTGFTSYSASGSTISTLASERDASARLMVILADKLVAQLLVDPALT